MANRLSHTLVVFVHDHEELEVPTFEQSHRVTHVYVTRCKQRGQDNVLAYGLHKKALYPSRHTGA